MDTLFDIVFGASPIYWPQDLKDAVGSYMWVMVLIWYFFRLLVGFVLVTFVFRLFGIVADFIGIGRR